MQSQNTVVNQKLDIQSKIWFINSAFVQRRHFLSCKWCIWFSLSFFFFLLMVAQMVKCLSASNAGDLGPIPGLGRSPGEGNGNPLHRLPGKFHGWRNLVGYNPWARKEADTTERLHFLSFIPTCWLGQVEGGEHKWWEILTSPLGCWLLH